MIRKHIYFSGSVQGVGFRYRAYYIAQSLSLTGWVKNLWDGRVEMEFTQGIDRGLEELGHQRLIKIEHIEAADIPCVDEVGFDIAN